MKIIPTLKYNRKFQQFFISMEKLLSGRGSMQRWYVVAAAPNWSLNLTTPKVGATRRLWGCRLTKR
jgi:hypothetical protein